MLPSREPHWASTIRNWQMNRKSPTPAMTLIIICSSMDQSQRVLSGASSNILLMARSTLRWQLPKPCSLRTPSPINSKESSGHFKTKSYKNNMGQHGDIQNHNLHPGHRTDQLTQIDAWMQRKEKKTDRQLSGTIPNWKIKHQTNKTVTTTTTTTTVHELSSVIFCTTGHFHRRQTICDSCDRV